MNKLSDTLLRKLHGKPAEKNTFYSDGGNLSVKYLTSGKLTCISHTGPEREGRHDPNALSWEVILI